jgi:hypothetical protein
MTGQNPKKRWASGKGYKGQPIYDAIQKCGWANVDNFIIRDGMTKEEAEQEEKSVILKLSSFESKLGYNFQSGGLSGYSTSAETKQKQRISCTGWLQSDNAKQKISLGNKGKRKNIGMHHSEETRKKISESNKGKIRSSECCARLSAQRIGRSHKGAVMTPEWRKKFQLVERSIMKI